MTKFRMLGAVALFSVLSRDPQWRGRRSSIPTLTSKGRVAPTISWETPIPSRRIIWPGAPGEPEAGGMIASPIGTVGAKPIRTAAGLVTNPVSHCRRHPCGANKAADAAGRSSAAMRPPFVVTEPMLPLDLRLHTGRGLQLSGLRAHACAAAVLRDLHNYLYPVNESKSEPAFAVRVCRLLLAQPNGGTHDQTCIVGCCCSPFFRAGRARHGAACRRSPGYYTETGTCPGHEAGNPYTKEEDYMAWSGWRARGGWDDRNDMNCVRGSQWRHHAMGY